MREPDLDRWEGGAGASEGPLRAAALLALMACSVCGLTYALLGARPETAAADPALAAATDAARPVAPLAAATAEAAGPGPAREAADGEAGEEPELPFHDELLETPMLGHPEFVAEVRRWVRYWETAPVLWFPDYLARMAAFSEIVDTTLAAHDLPWSLRYLPVIESGYSPSAVSSASAVGMWQFMPHTARDFDIEVGALVDDRRDPFVSTAAAADFLVQLRDDFGSWFLALAAYNAGPERIRGIIARHAPDAEPSDALYWAIRRFLPRETADFVPNLFGAIIVATDPEGHGYTMPEAVPFAFDRVSVLGQVTFETAALASGSSRDEIARLNPEYLRGVTPHGKVVDLRLPAGRGAAFRQYFADKAAAAGPG